MAGNANTGQPPPPVAPGSPGAAPIEERPRCDALEAFERRLLEALRASPVGISLSTLHDGRIIDINDEYLRILGFERDEVVGRTSHELRLWTVTDQRDELVREVAASARWGPRPVTLRRRDGGLVTVLLSVSSLTTGGEERLLGWVVDITARLRAEDELRASEEKWRTLAESAPVVIMTLDRDGTVLSVNRTVTGRPTTEYLGRDVVGFLHPDCRERGRAMLEAAVASGRPAAGEFAVAAPDGSPFWFQVSVAPTASSRPDGGVILVATEIDARRRAEEALRESEQRFRDIVQSLGDWVWEVDAEGRLTYAAPQVEGLFGFTAAEMIGRTPWDTCAPEDRDRDRAAEEELRRRPRPFRDLEIWHLHRDGRRVCLSISGVPMVDAAGAFRGFRGVAHDVTQRRREEAEVQQARRVESLGVLAGGIAHDFNNLLTAILGNADLALAELREGSARQLVEQIQAAGEHAAQLTRQMLAYAGRGTVAPEPVDLSAAVREIDQLLGASIPKKVALALALADRLPAVEADPAMLRQVVMNLVMNAAEAIGDRAGRIEVRTFSRPAADAFRADLELGAIPSGRERVCLEVADSGGGIRAGDLARIFDPFFTTRFAGRGLGLAAVLGIVLRHRGAVAVQTAPGVGSTFRASFPALPDAAAPARAPAPPPPPAPPAASAAWRGRGRVLLVDDEEPVRRTVSLMLRSLGFEAVVAWDGREALAAVAADAAGELRAVLLDLVMPGMDGRETLRELRRLRVDLPVVLCSGYRGPAADGGPAGAGTGWDGFLAKPFRLEVLARELRRALGE